MPSRTRRRDLPDTDVPTVFYDAQDEEWHTEWQSQKTEMSEGDLQWRDALWVDADQEKGAGSDIGGGGSEPNRDPSHTHTQLAHKWTVSIRGTGTCCAMKVWEYLQCCLLLLNTLELYLHTSDSCWLG